MSLGRPAALSAVEAAIRQNMNEPESRSACVDPMLIRNAGLFHLRDGSWGGETGWRSAVSIAHTLALAFRGETLFTPVSTLCVAVRSEQID
jgi:hypothetical protein